MNTLDNTCGPFTVYKASAGSGKTFTLTAEYIAMLLGDETSTHRNILAVTFTNKATAEMKERILKELWNLSVGGSKVLEGDFAKAVVSKLPPIAPSALILKAKEAMKGILHDYDYFQVSTIDSFFQSLLSNLAHELGLPAGYRVDLNDKDIITQAVAEVIANPKDHPGVKDWIIHYILERIEENKRWDISKDVTRIAGELTSEVFMEKEGELRDCINDGVALGSFVRKLKAIEAHALTGIKTSAMHFDALLGDDTDDYSLFYRGNTLKSYVEKLKKGILDEPSATVKGFIEKDAEVWLKKADRGNASLLDLVRSLQPQLRSLECIRAVCAKTVNNCRLSYKHINSLRLLGEVDNEVSAIMKENNSFLLAKTPRLFKALDESDAEFVFEKAGTELHHIMIDEFQDTSSMQWDNFLKLFMESFSRGYSCMLVGDVKQSIYRFRGGDWGILAGIERSSSPWKPKMKNLDVNFRSCRAVINFNNGLFPRAAKFLDEHPVKDECETVGNIYKDVVQKDSGKSGGEVEIRIEIDESRSKKEDDDNDDIDIVPVEDELAWKILELHEKGLEYSGMAVLVRYNKDADKLLTLLAANYPEIPVVSDEAFTLSASPAIQLIINALRFMEDGHDSVARSYVAKTYNEEVLEWCPSWSDICAYAPGVLPEEYAFHLEELRHMALYELCERLLLIFRVSDIPDSAPYVCSFMDSVQAYIDENPPSIPAFLNYWDETLYKKPIPAGETNGVRILTIHKSKGLAFPAVLMPYCDWDLQKSRTDDILWCEAPEEPYNEVKLLPIPVYSKKAVVNSIYASDYNKELRQRRIENLNLMYVAFTRAVSNLYVWAKAHEEFPAEMTMGDVIYGSLKGKLNQDHSGRLVYFENDGEKLPVVSYKVGDGGKLVQDNMERKANPFSIVPAGIDMPFNTFKLRTTFVQSNDAANFIADIEGGDGGKQEEYIEKGKLLHYVFSTIKKASDVTNVMDSLLKRGIVKSQEAVRTLTCFIEKCISMEKVADWFSGTWDVVNERSIISLDESGNLRSRRPDRVMTRGGEAVVVDFKFGKFHESHSTQVEEYCGLLGQMGYSTVSGYLWYVYSGEVKRIK